ncbi:3D domain-containing protein [Deinococcus depolymerans]|uniref:3D domain-containing protein n=1 Tax=Deinococcus depolymerans TaxID=392408 RepID=A0ABN1CDW2_9DEIO
MLQPLIRWTRAVLFSLAGVASATPALPASTVATDAVRDALSAAPTAATPTAQTQSAAQVRAEAVARAEASRDTVALTPIRGKTAIARSTAYNSVPGQTDATPYITATGTRTRPGVVALSRDLLRTFPYGTKVMIEDLSGKYSNMLRGRVFVVEDTMAARKTNSVDVWMATRSEALNWGARQIRITAVR